MTNNNKKNMKIRYEAMFVLHSLGDTLGFRNNTIRKYKNVTLDVVNELVYSYFELGGMNGIDISKWHSSDDTLFHIATTKAMLKYKGKLDKVFLLIVKNEIIRQHNRIYDDRNIIYRDPGYVTTNTANDYTEETDASHKPYNELSGGNGCAMKMHCVGACLYGKEKRDELINVSIRIGKFTHNSPIGFLGGLVSALFTAFAIEGMKIEEWPFEMLEILKSKSVKKHIKFGDSEDSLKEVNDYLEFIKIWKKYLESRFNNKKVINNKSHKNLMLRVKYYHQLLVVDTKAINIGDSGYGVGIMAYDGLLDCTGNWEKLFVYTALHPGDTDTVCAVASGWYGMYYGYGDVPIRLIGQMEFGDKLKKLSDKIFKNYYH